MTLWPTFTPPPAFPVLMPADAIASATALALAAAAAGSAGAPPKPPITFCSPFMVKN